MEEAPEVLIPRVPSSLDASKINQLYNLGTLNIQHLKSKVSYVWPDNENEEQKLRQEKWLLGGYMVYKDWQESSGETWYASRPEQSCSSN
jgi:hypothetical protein